MKETIVSDSIDWLRAVGYIIAAFFGVKYDALVAWIALMLIDSIVGGFTYAMIEGFKMSKFTIGILAKFGTILVPLTLVLVAKATGRDFEDVGIGVSILISVFAFVEGLSILAHFQSMRTGKRTKLKDDYITMAVQWITNRFKAALKVLLDLNNQK